MFIVSTGGIILCIYVRNGKWRLSPWMWWSWLEMVLRLIPLCCRPASAQAGMTDIKEAEGAGISRLPRQTISR